MDLVEKLNDTFLCPVESYPRHDMPSYIALGNSPIYIRYYDFLLVVPQKDFALYLWIIVLFLADVLDCESDIIPPRSEL